MLASIILYNIGGHPAFNVRQNDSDRVLMGYTPASNHKRCYAIPPDPASGFTELWSRRYQELELNGELRSQDLKKDASSIKSPETERFLEDAQASIGLSHHACIPAVTISPKAPFQSHGRAALRIVVRPGQWPQYQVIEVGPSNVSTQ